MVEFQAFKAGWLGRDFWSQPIATTLACQGCLLYMNLGPLFTWSEGGRLVNLLACGWSFFLSVASCLTFPFLCWPPHSRTQWWGSMLNSGPDGHVFDPKTCTSASSLLVRRSLKASETLRRINYGECFSEFLTCYQVSGRTEIWTLNLEAHTI